jgi:transcriptional regulator with XRE-family HTH domain
MTDQKTPNPNEGGEKLYAGKFKTVEELEAGYKNSLPVFQENENLKKKVDEVTKIPDEYMTPADIALHDEDAAEVKRLAKNSGLTQAQYEKLARETHARTKSNVDSYEAAKKELGADKINQIQDFVTKTYGEKVGAKLLKDAITNKEIREELLAQRTAALNSAAPGMGRTGGAPSYSVTKKDVLTARTEMEKVRGKARVEARNKYISLQRQYAHQERS